MCDAKFRRVQVIRYLAWTFGLAYLIQIVVAYLYHGGNRSSGQLVIAGMMFVPALGVLLAGGDLKGMGWKPRIRKNIRIYLIAWFAPLVLTAAGSVLYFLFFPGHFDLSGEYLVMNGGADAMAQLEAQGVSYPVFVAVSAVEVVTFAPVINTFAALGEEIGWRGFLYPQLKARFGRRNGLILGGVIWGAWHWPLIALIGYEYGAAAGNATGYVGFPVTGMLLFAVITAGWGILHDWLYEKGGSIWVPSIFHGAINAAGTLPLSVCVTNTGSVRLLGPVPVGILAGLPYLVLAAVLLNRREEIQNPG